MEGLLRCRQRKKEKSNELDSIRVYGFLICISGGWLKRSFPAGEVGAHS